MPMMPMKSMGMGMGDKMKMKMQQMMGGMQGMKDQLRMKLM